MAKAKSIEILLTPLAMLAAILLYPILAAGVLLGSAHDRHHPRHHTA